MPPPKLRADNNRPAVAARQTNAVQGESKKKKKRKKGKNCVCVPRAKYVISFVVVVVVVVGGFSLALWTSMELN